MKLGYPIRFARYAFLIGLLALGLSGAVVFSLNVVTVRTEGFQSQLSSRFQREEGVEEETEDPVASASPEPVARPAPVRRSVNQVALRRTVHMLYPMLYYLGSTGFLWALTSWKKGRTS